jgi:putative membrane protein
MNASHPLDAAAAWLASRRSVVAVLVPLVGAGGFILERLLGRVAWTEAVPALEAVAAGLRAANRFPPLLVAANVAMALPLVLGLRRVWDRRSLVGVILLALWSYLIEGIGVRTGWPYGQFQYALGLEPLLLGLVPAALPLFWLPMVFSSRLLASRLLSGPLAAGTGRPPRSPWSLLLLSTLLLVLLDAVLDPPAVGVGFWAYAVRGVYYGVPISNYLGWCFSSLVAQGLLLVTVPEARLRSARPEGFSMDSLRAFLLFWGLVAAALGQVIPGLLALALAGLERHLGQQREAITLDT